MAKQPATKTSAKPAPASKAVVTTQPKAAVPSFIKKGVARGTESVQAKDLIIPRLDLMQDISPQVQDGDIEAGHWRNSVTEEDIGDEVLFVPIVIDIRYLLWRPRHDGGKILARCDDGVHWSPPNGEWEVSPYKDNKKIKVTWRTAPTVEQSGLAAWGSMDPSDPDSPPAANKMVVVFGVDADNPTTPLIVSHQRGSFKVGNKFMSRVKFDNMDAFAKQYHLRAERAQNAEGQSFWVPKWTAAGFVDEKTYNLCESLYKSLQSKEWQIHNEEDMQEHAGGDPEGEARGARRDM